MTRPLRVTLANFRHQGHHVEYSAHIVRGLQARGVGVHLVGSGEFIGALAGRTDFQGTTHEVRYSSEARESLQDRFHNVRRAMDLAQSQGSDILHFLHLDPYVPQLALIGLPTGRPAVCGTLHWTNSVEESHAGPLGAVKRRIKRASFARCVRRGLRVLVHSESTALTLTARTGVPAFDPIPYPIGWPENVSDHGRDKAAARLRFAVPAHAKVLLIFGHTNRYKGYGVAMEALALLPPDFHLIVAGPQGDVDHAELTRLASAAGVADRVTFDLRFIPDPEMVDCFRAADALLVPYDGGFGGQSGPLTLAAALGCPVVATDNPVLKETIDRFELGTTVAPGRPQQLADAVLRTCGRPSPGRVEAFRAQHSPASFVDAIVASYERALRPHPSGDRVP